MVIAAQRLHGTLPIASERRGKPAADVSVARAAEVYKPDPAEKARGKAILRLAGYQEHPTRAPFARSTRPRRRQGHAKAAPISVPAPQKYSASCSL